MVKMDSCLVAIVIIASYLMALATAKIPSSSHIATISTDQIPAQPTPSMILGERGRIKGRLLGDTLPNTQVLLHSSSNLITGTSVRLDGTFEFFSVDTPATYTLTVVNAVDFYDRVRVTLDKSGRYDSVMIVENPLGKLIELDASKRVIKFQPRFPIKYFMDKESFDLMPYLRNPVVIVAILCIIMVLVMPYFVDQLDSETYAELTGDKRPSVVDPTELFARFAFGHKAGTVQTTASLAGTNAGSASAGGNQRGSASKKKANGKG